MTGILLSLNGEVMNPILYRLVEMLDDKGDVYVLSTLGDRPEVDGVDGAPTNLSRSRVANELSLTRRGTSLVD